MRQVVFAVKILNKSPLRFKCTCPPRGVASCSQTSILTSAVPGLVYDYRLLTFGILDDEALLAAPLNKPIII